MKKRLFLLIIGTILACGIVHAALGFPDANSSVSKKQNYMTFQSIMFPEFQSLTFTGDMYFSSFGIKKNEDSWMPDDHFYVLNPWTFEIVNEFNGRFPASYVTDFDDGNKLFIQTSAFDSKTRWSKDALFLIDKKTGKKYKELKEDKEIEIEQIFHDRNNGIIYCMVATGNDRQKLLKIRISDLEILGIYNFFGLEYFNSKIAASQDGKRFFITKNSADKNKASQYHNTLEIYNANDLTLLRNITVGNSVKLIYPTKNNQLYIWIIDPGNADSKLQVYSIESGKLLRTIDTYGIEPHDLAEDNDGKLYSLALKYENMRGYYIVFILDPGNFTVETRMINYPDSYDRSEILSVYRFSERLAVKNGKLRLFFIEMRSYSWEDMFPGFLSDKDRLCYIDVE
jgi:hypothetical protein